MQGKYSYNVQEREDTPPPPPQRQDEAQPREQRQQEVQLQRLAAYKRAFRKASLRWHPDKFEGRFGALLCGDVKGECARPQVAAAAAAGGFLRDGTGGGGGANQLETESMMEEGESHADAIRRRVRVISQHINDAWSAVCSSS